MPESKLNGAVIVVFGGTGGIGTALCQRLDDRGAKLVVAARGEERLHEACRRYDEARPFVVDGRDFDQVEACFAFARDTFGRVDGAVNCVGSIFLKPAHRTSAEDWRETMGLNLDSAFATVRAATTAMQERGGSIVLISTAAAVMGLANHDAIAAAKAGIIGLTRSAAATYARRRIRINCVAPGLVETPLSETIRSHKANRDYSLGLHPLGRFGTPDDIASAILFFLNPANDWITAQCLAVDGGLSTIKH